MRTTVTIEGLDKVQAKFRRAVTELEADCRGAALDAAAAGVTEAQQNHPYQDWRQPGKSYEEKGAIGLTDTSHAEQPKIGSQREGFEAFMVWPAPYGKFVNDGTSRSRAYPFVPTAIDKANTVLEEGVARAVENFKRNAG